MGGSSERSVESWRALGVQVILLGDVAEAARELDAEHVPGLELTAHGTPRLDSAFLLADEVARFPLRCFVNADVIFRLTCSRRRARGLRAWAALPRRRADGGGRPAARCGGDRLVRLSRGTLRRHAAVCHRPRLLRQLARLEGAAGRHRRRRDARRARDTPAARLRARRRRHGRGVLRRGSGAKPRARRRQEPPVHAPRREPRPPRREAPPQSRRAAAVARERAQGSLEAGPR